MSFKDLDASFRANAGERPEFNLAGQHFKCRVKVPWKKYSSMLLTLNGADVTTIAGLKKTEDFFRLVLVREDVERFIELINRDGDSEEYEEDEIVDPKQIAELLDWLLDEYSGKATVTDESFSVTPLDAGQPAKPVSLNPVTN